MKKKMLILAGGNGIRMQSAIPKQFIEIGDRPILMHTMERIHLFDSKIELILVLPADYFELWKTLCSKHMFTITHQTTKGGTTRFESVRNGLSFVEDHVIVGIHDSVRPFVSNETLQRCFSTAEQKGNAIPVLPIYDSIRLCYKNGSISVNRDDFRIVQTPQTFRSEEIKQAYRQPFSPLFTDDASVAEAFGMQINLVNGNKENIKITTPFDLKIATCLL